MRHPGRLWFRTRIGGADWQVRFASYDVVQRLIGRNCEGGTDPNTHTILLPWTLCDTPSRLKLVVLHELIHASCSGPGECHRLCKLLRCSEEELEDLEEDLCVHLTPLLVEALGSYWKLPKPPKRRGT